MSESLEQRLARLDNEIVLIKEQLELTWPIICGIYQSHLIKGASRVLFWGRINKIGRRLSPTEVTFIDTLLDEFRKISTQNDPVGRAMILFCDEKAGKTQGLGTIEGGVLERVKEQVKRGGLLNPTSLPNHLANFVPVNYPSDFAGFVDNNGFMSMLKVNVRLIFIPSNCISMNINHFISL